MAWNTGAREALDALQDEGYSSHQDRMDDLGVEGIKKKQTKRGKAQSARNAAKRGLEIGSKTNKTALDNFRRNFARGK